MNNNQFTPNAISHKDLNTLFNKAKKELSILDNCKSHSRAETQEFNDLIQNWTETSQKILSLMNKKDQILTENRNPKSLMAFGAMGAHINMALQALKAAELDK